MSGMVYGSTKAGSPAALMARVTGANGAALAQSDLSAIEYTIYVLGEIDHSSQAAVANHTAVAVAVASVIFDALQTSDDAWTVDDTGYNFKHTPSDVTAEPFALQGRTYRVVYTLTISGASLTVEFRVTTHRDPDKAGYCTRQDIEGVFGADNVAHWADMQNNKNGDHIAARIGQAVEWAKAEIDERLREGPYELPLVSPPVTIVTLAAELAGVWLYENRGVEDFDQDTGRPQHRLSFTRSRAEKTLHDLLMGRRRLTLAHAGKGIHVPRVVKK